MGANVKFEEERLLKVEEFRAQAKQYDFTRQYEKAVHYLVKAGNLGDLDSIREVLRKVRSGYGMTYAYNEFFSCMLIGAKAGIPDAMYEVYLAYSSGIGTDINKEEANIWLTKAAEAGQTDAIGVLKRK